jgi:S-DNA-T family DNA segregation ATPase FtsK/SpoIIIE
VTTADFNDDMLGEVGHLRAAITTLSMTTREEAENAVATAETALHDEETQHAAAVETNRETHTVALRTAKSTREAAIEHAESAFIDKMSEIDDDAEAICDRIQSKARTNVHAAKVALEEASWVAETVFEANENRPREQFEEHRSQVETALHDVKQLESQTRRELRRYWQPRPRFTPLSADDLDAALGPHPHKTVFKQLAAMNKFFEVFRQLSLARIFRGPTLILPAAVFAGAGAGIAIFFQTGERLQTLGYGSIGGLALFTPVAIALYVLARRQVTRAYQPLARAAAIANYAGRLAIESATSNKKVLETRLTRDRERDIGRAKKRFEPLIGETRQKADERLDEIARRIPLLRERATQKRKKAIAHAKVSGERSVVDADAAHTEADATETIRHDHARARLTSSATATWEAIDQRWKHELTRDAERLDVLQASLHTLFPRWDAPEWRTWSPADSPPPAIQLGQLAFDRTAIEGGPPTDERLAVEVPTLLELPAVIALPRRASLVIEVSPDHREEGLDILRSAMLRILATVPPGKAKFTILDPVGLGQNFAGFMHLEDECPGLIGERIWTEARHIEQKLLDLTEHMETVIQKYLRNEFRSIDEYNAEAGEIAEPYRFLVIADFPTNFHDQSARRLASILSSGPRCGVFTLLLRDLRGGVPEQFDVADLARHAVLLRSEGDRLIFDSDDLGHLPFTPDPGPSDELLIEISHKVGRAAHEASRVEVPFEMIAPNPEEFWSESSSKQLKIALGRAGATKLQYLSLGVGTAQHALIAGKTGSGKSTLLHALITNLACWYSPDEVEFYLVDFKKGVEFKTYATHKLPHARAVAVESDREFGLSVLQGLDDELKRRGELFRDEGTQDVAAWRAKTGDVMPRVLLVIDEFQELFVEDDKVSQDASLLLDRLVRQGRAFGMHVVLGSQTLGGAYSLNRSTMGQMGVRIALQCSEQDSMLILSDDNVAARLLARPGEAIYNDQGGLVEGNNPFQVCWLPDDVREGYLTHAAEKANEVFPDRPNRCIVFEGNAPASLTTNGPLRALLESPASSPPTAVPMWLGDAVAIKDPTLVGLRRQAGGNLVVIGQQDEHALATMSACLIAAAASHPADSIRFVVLDGTPADDPNAGYLERLATSLQRECRCPGFREAGDAVIEIATVLAERIESGATDQPAIVLLVHGLQRFRSLRRDDDDFGFSMDADAPITADKAFGQLIKEGPEFGIFTLIWCDTVPSLERSVDRQGMRGFDHRAMFQVSSTDSSTMIDSPAAANLGGSRGLLYSEERGTIEKFRPWQLPSDALVAQIARKLAT